MAVIKSKRFTLRPYRDGDEKSLVKNINNKEIHRATLLIPYPYTPEHARDWIKENKGEPAGRPEKISLVIDIRGKVAGSVALSNIEGDEAGIGYWLGEKYRGRGIATEAVQLVTEYGFGTLGLKRIYARVFPFNKASMRVLEKTGFLRKELQKKGAVKNGKRLDIYLYERVK